jgi:hypothetical protein
MMIKGQEMDDKSISSSWPISPGATKIEIKKAYEELAVFLLKQYRKKVLQK